MSKHYDVLVIDDNLNDYELCQRMLCDREDNTATDLDYELRHAKNGQQGLDEIDRQSPHCILLDCSLSENDGLKILKKIHENYPLIPVIIFNEQHNKHIAEEALKNGASHYLMKSEITTELLDSAIRRGLEKIQLDLNTDKERDHRQDDVPDRKTSYNREMENPGIIAWEYNVENDQLFVEKNQFEILFGESLDASYLTLMQLRERIHPDDISELTSLWQAHLKNPDNDLDMTYRLRHKNGAWLWIRERGKTVAKTSAGKAIKIEGIYEDISEGKHEEDVFNQLYRIALDSTLSLEQNISRVLRLALNYLGLEFGLVSKIREETYQVIHCEPLGQVEPGSIFPYSNTYCSHVFGSREVKAWHNAKNSEIASHPCYQEQMYETYIGTTLYLNQVPYGTLALHQKPARSKPFSSREKTVLRLIGQWVSSEITRQANLKKIEESNNFLRLVQDSIPDLIFVKDDQYRIVRANPAYLNTLIPSLRDSAIGSTVMELYPEKDAKTYLELDKKALKEGHSEQEEAFTLPDGEERILHTKKIRFQDSEQKQFILGVSRDITEIRQAEADRKELHEAMTNTVEGISQIDPEGRYIYLNEAYARMCGYQPQELVGKSWEITVDKAEHESMKIAYQEMLDTGKVIAETVGIRKDGSNFHKRVTMISRINDNGRFIGHHCFMNDISQHKEAEARLAESEERYELAVRGSSVGLWDWNVKTGELFWSDRFKEIVDISETEFRSRYEEFSERLHPEDKEKIETALFSHLKNKTPYDVEYRLRRTDNTYVWIHARGQAIWDDDGNALRMAGSVDDISTQKLAQEEILRSNLELSRFAYVASHDLQEPLRMVMSFTQLLEKNYGDKLDDRALQFIQYASKGASRMQQLVRDLLAYARIGNKAEKLEQFDLNNLKESIKEDLLNSITQAGAEINWTTLPTILADPVHIRSVFQNLIGNAIKYRKSDVSPKIDVSVDEQSDKWVFSVTDNGIGMKQEYCEKIFEPFQRLHRKEEYSGTGMGLAICKKSVEGMGGKIWAKSELGKGSIFYFSLPKIK